MLILEFCAGSNLSILFVFWFSIFFPTLTHSLCRPDYVGSRRSPSLLSYSDIGPTPLSSSPPSLFGKFETKTETKTFTVDIEAPSESEHGGEKREDATRKPSLSFRIPERISLSLGITVSRFILPVAYFVSVFLYIVLPKSAIQVFWFFYIVGNTVIEACLSLTPIEQAQKVVKKIEQNNWRFLTNDKNLPMIDIMIVAYLPNEKDIIIDRIASYTQFNELS